MPAFGDVLQPDEINDLIAYLHSCREKPAQSDTVRVQLDFGSLSASRRARYRRAQCVGDFLLLVSGDAVEEGQRQRAPRDGFSESQRSGVAAASVRARPAASGWAQSSGRWRCPGGRVLPALDRGPTPSGRRTT